MKGLDRGSSKTESLCHFLLLALSGIESALLFLFGVHLDPLLDVVVPAVAAKFELAIYDAKK